LTIRRIGWAGVEIVSEAGTRVVVDPYQSGAERFHSGLPESSVTPEDLFGAALSAGLPKERLAPLVSGVELYVRDVTIKALPARRCRPGTIRPCRSTVGRSAISP
jgi:L-ascorbate metabolism protein UlaG (beta-lactamase superfamily)